MKNLLSVLDVKADRICNAVSAGKPDGIPACARFNDCLPPNEPLERCQCHVGDGLPQLVVVFLDRSGRQYVLDTSHPPFLGARCASVHALRGGSYGTSTFHSPAKP